MNTAFLRQWRSKLLRNSRKDDVDASDETNKQQHGFENHGNGLSNALSRLGDAIRPWLPPVNFITIHWTYFVLVSLLASVIFWGCARPAQSIDYWDSLFLTVSALTSAGLNSLNLSSEWPHNP